MKKIILACLLSLTMLLSFAGCGTQVHTHPGEDSEKQSTIENAKQPSGNSSDNSSSATGVPSNSDISGNGTAALQESSVSSSVADSILTTDEAKAIAFQNAGVKEADIRDLEVELDRDNGVLSYEIKFDIAGKEYEYHIHAETGKILSSKSEKESDGKSHTGANSSAASSQSVSSSVSSSQSSAATAKLTREEAKAIAFKDAGVKEANIKDLEIELDRDDGVLSYEIKFDSAGKEYEYDIHADTGKILSSKSEKESDRKSNTGANSSAASSQSVSSSVSSSQSSAATAKLTREEAKAIAFKDAGVKEADVRNLEIELDKDDGVLSYEIEFKSGGAEYKYDIHANTGKILEKDKDYD